MICYLQFYIASLSTYFLALGRLTDAFDFRAEREKFSGKVMKVLILNVICSCKNI